MKYLNMGQWNGDTWQHPPPPPFFCGLGGVGVVVMVKIKPDIGT